ncbi:OLC1v1037055C1 [Oldenlandia corymbosa var. corymbosa]|uniref:OLC1v1037055C1 n=1 Tax=Oldenlandia corymbosa var. corymbosa TaxID=529605 RepID=A0AAV1CYV1_OLDCO|nr:OLC1v1037055C1 [Oldenlandia corymbosa var. corymbosa]
MMMNTSVIVIVFISVLCFLSLPSPALSDAECNSDDLKVIQEIQAFWIKYNVNLNAVGFTYECDRDTGRIIQLEVFSGNISAPIPPPIGTSSPEASRNLLDTGPELHPTFISPTTISPGPVPESFGNLNFSIEIDLSRNQLDGDPSFLFGKSKTVQSIDLSRNMFEFNFSKVEIPVNLTYLDLSHNKIFGSLPQGLTEMRLGSLNVSYNRLCGEIPQGGELQSFQFHEYSFLHNRCLCGAPLPPCK